MVPKSAFDPAQYGSFEYREASYDAAAARFVGTYALVGDAGEIELSETIELPAAARGAEVPGALVRLLHLACGLSYYKAAAAPRVVVRPGLTAAERALLEALFRGGLGEFAYRNDLPGALRPAIEADAVESPAGAEEWSGGRPLVAVGGGKDSVVSIEATARAGLEPLLFSVNQYAVIDACVDASGLDVVRARRTLDPRLRELNEAGAHNGHVPVTAINSLVALMTAAALGLGPVVMSNEESANHGNLEWRGATINHQWSKTLEFERLLRSTLAAEGLDAGRYFSLLRPFTELEIAAAFARLPQYFDVITSCNRAFTLDPRVRATGWCGECSKCRFVFLMLATAMPRERVEQMIGRNPLGEAEALDEYREIVGLAGNKPFECVGDVAEAESAVRQLAGDPAWADAATLAALASELPERPTPLAIGTDRAHLWEHLPPAYRAAVEELFDD